MNTRRGMLGAALIAAMLAGPAAAQTGSGVGGSTDPNIEGEQRGGGAAGAPSGSQGPAEERGTGPAQSGTTGMGERGRGETLESDGGRMEEQKPKKKRRWWRRDGPLEPREERRQLETRPDTTHGGEPMGPTTTTPAENDTRR